MTGFVVSILQEYVNSYVAVLSISVSNAIVPSICKALTLGYERHIEESSSQISVFLKVTLVRWANTAILIYALTPNQDTIRRGDDFDLLQKCSTLFLSEIFLIPMLRIADIRGFLHKHILAPRCKNQDKLMFYFTGTKYFIGDLYAVSFISSFARIWLQISLILFSVTGCDEEYIYGFLLFGYISARISTMFRFAIHLLLD